MDLYPAGDLGGGLAVTPVTFKNGRSGSVPVVALLDGGGGGGGGGGGVSNPATIVTGQAALAANTRAQLPANALVNGLIVKSSPNNTASVLIGGVGVTTAADGTGNGYILSPGEAASFGVANASAIYAISTAAAVLSFQGN
jgi:hypothetical protein